MAYTPGPWGIQPDEHGGPSDTVYAYEDQQQPVAEIVSGVLADRTLIAAAPDLLEALRLLAAMVEREYAGFDAVEEWQIAHAAIAKAEGRSE